MVSKIEIKDFTYTLPEEKIAKYPLENRDSSKLLIYKQERITEDVYRNIASYIPPKSLLVFNNSKVIEARLLFQKPSGGVIEIFCLEPDEQYGDISSAMAVTEKVLWKCLVGGASKWKAGQVLQKKILIKGREIIFSASYIQKLEDSFIIELSWSDATLSFAEIIHYAGATPLPPYIKREAEKMDAERYQTVYADPAGSVAAPTAGLHFTDKVFKDLEERDIKKEFVTLHVGAGTFKPVKAAILEDHEMHAEFIDVDISSIKNILHYNGHITAVGTTSLRTLETLYWIGVKIINDASISDEEIVIHQWDAYTINSSGITTVQSLEALIRWMEKKNKQRLLTKTQLLIAPGYTIRLASALVTNFHQPQSTLLLLVAAFAGAGWRKIYEYALENDFRFLSYGDGCLIIR